MRLLPDLRINGHYISIQSPYTLDGRLIVQSSFFISGEIYLKNDMNTSIAMGSYYFEHLYNNLKDYVSTTQYIDERGITEYVGDFMSFF